MIEVVGDMWSLYWPLEDQKVQVCITTNGVVKANGCAVMGAGCAQQARDRFPGIDQLLGARIRKNGNLFQVIYPKPTILAFPVKHKWNQMADVKLIARSTEALKGWAEAIPHITIVLPRPGCGNGQLDWSVVKPIVSVLPDNVHVIDLPRRGAR